jgi:hypothetical protein
MAQTQQFRGTARRIEAYDHGSVAMSFFYHNTAVVSAMRDGSLKLDSGGWLTATTKLAMNQASNEFGYGFSVSQRKGDWYVNWQGKELPFTDGMVLSEEQS